VHSHHIFVVLVWKSINAEMSRQARASYRPYLGKETRMKSGGGIWLERTGKLWARAAHHM
jgi:hypothetical protein